MTLHLPTLGAVFVIVTAVLGALLVGSWALNRQVPALACWGSAFFLIAAAMGLVTLGEGTLTTLTLLIANCFVALTYGVFYTGCRVFNGRTATLPSILTGATVWCLAFPFIVTDESVRLALMSAIAAGYSAVSAWELWRHARQNLKSQRILIGVAIFMVGFNAFRGVLGFSAAQTFWIDGLARRWSSPMAIVLVILIPTIAFIFLSMAKEQLEDEYKRDALIDPLTGIPNRRAFFQNASALLSRLRDAPASCLLFDLDNFKSLNDSYGHEVGDHVLEIFGHVLSEHLPGGVFGRLGGEEFGAIIPLGKAGAEAEAEKIRRSFASVGKIVRGLSIDVTVSVGCSTGVKTTAQELLDQADVALYRAKAEGRNLVASFRQTEMPTRKRSRTRGELPTPD